MQCRPDLKIGGVYWHTDEAPHKLHLAPQQQTCVDWDSLVDWIRPRFISFTDGVTEGAISPEGLLHNKVLVFNHSIADQTHER